MASRLAISSLNKIGKKFDTVNHCCIVVHMEGKTGSNKKPSPPPFGPDKGSTTVKLFETKARLAQGLNLSPSSSPVGVLKNDSHL